MRYQRLMKRLCNGCIVLAFLSIMMGVHVVTTHSLGYAGTQSSATQSSATQLSAAQPSGTPTSNSQPSGTQASGTSTLTASSPAGSTNISSTATNPSDANKPVTLTDEQMKQYYFINLTLQYKALDTRFVPDDKTTFIQPDSDFGLLDTSWQNGSNSDPPYRKQHNDVLAKYRSVQFRFFDNTTNQEATNIKELDFGDPVNISRIFFGFNPDHEYKISIVNTTVPSPYALGFSLRRTDHISPVATTLTFKINQHYPLSGGAPVEKGDNWNIPYKFKDFQDHFVKTTLFMLPMEFIFANSAHDAKDGLTIEKDPATADKFSFVYHNEKIFKRVRIKDNKLDIPTEIPKRAGYKFLGWGYNLLFPKKADGTPDDDQNAYTIHNVLECTRQGNLTPDQENKCYSDYTNWVAEIMRFDARHMRPAYQWSIIRDGVINKYGMQKDFLHAESPVFIVFAVWKKIPSHTVTFDPQGGILHSSSTVTVEDSALLPKPQDPTKQNYDFLGWYLDTALWDFDSQTVTGDLTLKAKWKEKKKAPEPAPTPVPTPTPPSPKPEVTPQPQPKPPAPLTPPVIDPNKSIEPVPVPTPSVPLTPSPAVPPVPPTEEALNPSPAKQRLKTALPHTDDVSVLPALVLTVCASIAALSIVRRVRMRH